MPGGWVLGGARRVGRLALAEGIRSGDDALALTPGATAAHAVVLLGAFALRGRGPSNTRIYSWNHKCHKQGYLHRCIYIYMSMHIHMYIYIYVCTSL